MIEDGTVLGKGAVLFLTEYAIKINEYSKRIQSMYRKRPIVNGVSFIFLKFVILILDLLTCFIYILEDSTSFM